MSTGRISGVRSPSGTENRELSMPLLSEALRNLSRGSPSGSEYNQVMSMPMLSEALKALSSPACENNKSENNKSENNKSDNNNKSSPISGQGDIKSGTRTPSYPPSRPPPPPGHGQGIDNPLPPVRGPFIQSKSQPRLVIHTHTRYLIILTHPITPIQPLALAQPLSLISYRNNHLLFSPSHNPGE